MSETKSENSFGFEHETTNKSQKSMPKDIFYESCSKTYQIVRRIIFKDSNGIFKETLDVVNGEKQTIFGSPPDLAKYEDWMIEELTETHNIKKANEPTNASQSRVSSNSSDTDTNNVDKAHVSLLSPDISEEIQSIEYSHLKDLDSSTSFKPSTSINSSSNNPLEGNASRNDSSDGIKSNRDEKLDSSSTNTLDEIVDLKDSDSTFKPQTKTNNSSSNNPLEDNAFRDDSSDGIKSNHDEKLDSSSTLDEIADSRDSESTFKPKSTSVDSSSSSTTTSTDSSSSNTSEKIADSRDSDSTIKEDLPRRNRSSRHNRLSSRDSSASNTSDEIVNSKFTQNLDKTFRIARQFSRQGESSITNTSDEFADLLNFNEDSDLRHLQHEASSKYRPSTANAPNWRKWENGRNNNLPKTWSLWTTPSKIELEREQNEVINRSIYRNHDSVQSTQQQNFDCKQCHHLKSGLAAARPSTARLSSSRSSNTRSSNTRSSNYRTIYDGHQRSRGRINYGRKAVDYSRPTNDSIENLIEFLKQNYRPSNDRNMGSSVKFVEKDQQSHSQNQRRSNDTARNDGVESSIQFVKQNRPNNDRPRNLMEFVKQNQTYESDRNANKRMSKRIAKQQLKNINKYADRLPSLDSSDYVYGVSSTTVFSYSPRRRVNEPNRYFDRQAYALQGSQQPL